MSQKIASITLMVANYDDAIAFYTEKLGFELLEDTPLGETKRWVLVGPPNTEGVNLLLARATNVQQKKYIGRQAGGRVFLFLHTDNFQRDYEAMREKGVQFTELPREEAYGTVVVFKDLYGNLWDLVEPSSADK